MNFPNLLAATTADDIFKSMGESGSADINPMHVLAIAAAVVVLIVLITTLNRRLNRPPQKGKVSHPGRLLKQLAKEAGLSRKEVRELKKLAQLQGVENPLTLLLCPSLLQAAIAKRRAARS